MPQVASTSSGSLKISVCMAVRNGTNFIREQVTSILAQLREWDDFIIVDDASTDETIAVVQSFGDQRIRIISQEKNRGVVQSFERALTEATGDIVFLADHDDIWRADKVEKFLELFETNPDITVGMSDLVIIDATGKIASAPKFGLRKFHSSVLFNLVKNRYQGSAMALRRSVLSFCLPFPKDIPIHDAWIGMVNQFVGKAGFINEPLLYYRRHGSNDSPFRHGPLMQMLRWRYAMAKNLLSWYLRHVMQGRIRRK
jgi:glycosyltransferase involved in cell wall biosynthesis